jgi:Domain of unknown function (DUF4037)
VAFVPGLELARRFADEVVLPLVRDRFPEVAFSAALVGAGSDVLGYDTERSTDHDWGPRLQVFLADGGADRYGAAIGEMLAAELPPEFLGYPTGQTEVNERGTWAMRPPAAEPGRPVQGRDGAARAERPEQHGDGTAPAERPEQDGDGAAWGEPADGGPRRAAGGPGRHGVVVVDLGGWLVGQLGFDPRVGVAVADWLATPTQVLAEMTGGAVFHDGLGELVPARRRLAWYPDQVWRWVLACQWARIGEEEPWVGRCGEVGDDLGAAVVAARLARDLMRLHLLMARRYPPYGKWLGTAFGRLPDGQRLAAELRAALTAVDRQARERLLGVAYQSAAAHHNALGLTAPLDPALRPFHDRPFQVIDADRVADALRDTVTHPALTGPAMIGAIDQWADSSPVLSDRDTCRALTGGYH